MTDTPTPETSPETENDESHLEGLSALFEAGLEARQKGNLDRAIELLKMTLRREPRLAEPRLELGHIYLETARLEDAEIEIREGLKLLENGGQWVDSLSDDVMKGHAHNLLGEVLRRKADQDEVIFGNPAVFQAILKESRAHFASAKDLDPENDHAAHQDFFLNLDAAEDGVIEARADSGVSAASADSTDDA